MDILMESMKEIERKKEKVFLSEALGRVLAKDLVASFNSPSFKTSGMDGYALCYDDQKLGKLKISSSLPAGKELNNEVLKGECIKTFTGSLISKGADSLIPIENVEVDNGYIIIKDMVKKGFSVRDIGENFKKGELLIKKGEIISYPQIGVMASLNISQVEVFTKPKVAVISTGSEIVDVGEVLINSAQIISSNHFTIEAICKEFGADVNRIGVIGDDKEKIKKRIVEALSLADIVITTGGVSVGDYDFVKDIIKEFKPIYLLNGVKIKPGQHIKVVKIGQKYIFALPGFPYSSTITTLLYVLPLIKKMQNQNPNPKVIEAILEEDYIKKSKKEEFVACNLIYKEGRFFVNFQGKKNGTSAILTNMLGDIAIMQLGEMEKDKYKGEKIKIIYPLNW